MNSPSKSNFFKCYSYKSFQKLIITIARTELIYPSMSEFEIQCDDKTIKCWNLFKSLK